jgi:capsid protein
MANIAELNLRIAEHQSRFLESTLDLWDRLVRDDEMLDIDGRLTMGQPFGPTWSAGLAYTTESQLTEIRNQSRHLALTNEFAINALENRVSYVVGEGHSYKIMARAGAVPPKDLIARVDQVITAFITRNLWHQRQQECLRRWDRDGEVFLRWFELQDGLSVRFIEPELIGTPPGNTRALFGIEQVQDDAETAELYHVRETYGADRFEQVPASEIQHRKANVDLVVPRGVPTFYPVRKNLMRASKLLRNVSTVSEIQSAIAMVREHVASSKATIQQYVADQTDVKTRSQVTGAEKTYRQYPPGTIIDHGPGTKYTFPAQGIDVAKYVQALQAELRAVASRLVMPEFMLTSDASNANYSSTMVAEGPAVKMFERLQSSMIWDDLTLIMAEIRLQARRGVLPANVLDLVDVDADGPRVQTRDRLKDTQADQTLVTARVMSKQTMATRNGLDPADEQERIEAEEERETGFFGTPEPEATPEPPEPTTDADAEIQKLGLNGGQIGAMLQIVQAVAAGELPKGTAAALLAASFPMLSPEQITAIIEPIEEPEETAEPEANAAPPAPPVPPPPVAGETPDGEGEEEEEEDEEEDED